MKLATSWCDILWLLICRFHTSTTIRTPHIGQALPFGHLRYLARPWFNSHQDWCMTLNILYNNGWHVIIVQELIFCEIKKMLFVTPAEYAVSKFDFTSFFHVIGWCLRAKRGLNVSRSLCDWPKGGAWPKWGALIVLRHGNNRTIAIKSNAVEYYLFW